MVMLLTGCAMNFGTGSLVQNNAGAQVAGTDESWIDGEDVEDGGTDVFGGETDFPGAQVAPLQTDSNGVNESTE